MSELREEIERSEDIDEERFCVLLEGLLKELRRTNEKILKCHQGESCPWPRDYCVNPMMSFREEWLELSNRWATRGRLSWETGMEREPSGQERFEVLLEEVRHDFQLLAEGHVALDEKLNAVDRKVERIAKELSQKMDTGFGTIMKGIRELAERFDAHETHH